MEKCECWRKVKYQRWDAWRNMFLPYDRYECWGVKEPEEVRCGGDRSKCEFYPDGPEKPVLECEFYCTDGGCVDRNGHLRCPCNGNREQCGFYCGNTGNNHYTRYNEENETTTSCVVNNNKCTFDKKRDGKQMNTAQMWLAAQSDGKTYKVYDMRYSRQKGFHDKKGSRWNPDAFSSIEEIMNCQWVECKEMTRAEAEKKLGVDIID